MRIRLRIWGIWLALLWVGIAAGTARADAEIVVAMRYLLPTGVSHSHLYLYRVDGKFLRQLTTDNSGQDRNPVFAPDGETIVFTRQKPGGIREYWTVTPLGKNLRRLSAAPEWYRNEKGAPFFTNIAIEGAPAPDPNAEIQGKYVSPEGRYEIILHRETDPDLQNLNGPGVGGRHILRDTKTGEEFPFGKMPGFVGVGGILAVKGEPARRFLIEPGLQVVFCDLHLDSTAGDTVYALDLARRRFVNLSPYWAAPFPLPGESAFLTLTENRYVPIAGSKMTANCSYVERWDVNFHKIRYARPGAAARCYGASLYRPGKTPTVITVLGASD